LAGYYASLRFLTNDYATDEFREAKGGKELQIFSKYIISEGHGVA
jgi:hypothetical protein